MEAWWSAEQYTTAEGAVMHRVPSAEEIAEARRRLDGWRERLAGLQREWHEDGQWLVMLWGQRDPERAVARMADWQVGRVSEGMAMLSRILEGYEARAARDARAAARGEAGDGRGPVARESEPDMFESLEGNDER